MTDRPAPHLDDDGIEQLRNRIRELEDELASRPARPSTPRPNQSGRGLAKVVAAAMTATTVLMAWPAFLTVRRWFRWWHH